MKELLGSWFNARVALVAVLAVVGAGWYGYHKGGVDMRNKLEASRLKDEHIAQIAYDNAVRAASEEIGKIRITNKTIRQEVQHETEIRTQYRDCKQSDDVMRMLNAILAGKDTSESIAGAIVSETDAPAQ